MTSLALATTYEPTYTVDTYRDLQDALARLGFPRAVLAVTGHLARWAMTPTQLKRHHAEGRFQDREPCTVTDSLAQIAAATGYRGKEKGTRTIRRALRVLVHYGIVHKVQREWQTSKLILDFGALHRLAATKADDATLAQVQANVDLAYHGEAEAARRAEARAARAGGKVEAELVVATTSSSTKTTGPLTDAEQHAIVREALGEHWSLQHSILPRVSRRMWREMGTPDAATWRDQWQVVRAALDTCQAPIWRILRFELAPPPKNHRAAVLGTPYGWELRVKAARAHAEGRCACHASAEVDGLVALPVPVAAAAEHELVLDLEPNQVATLASDPVTAWSMALGELVRHLDPHDVEDWLVPTRLLVSGGRAVLKVPNEPWAEFVRDFLQRPVERVLAGMA